MESTRVARARRRARSRFASAGAQVRVLTGVRAQGDGGAPPRLERVREHNGAGRCSAAGVHRRPAAALVPALPRCCAHLYRPIYTGAHVRVPTGGCAREVRCRVRSRFATSLHSSLPVRTCVC